jgi:hypothetical protein
MTDKERVAGGFIIGKYVNEIAALIRKNDITPAKWKLWLSECYNYPCVHAIKIDALAGIMKVLTKTPEVIKNYKETKRGANEPV